MRRCEAKHKWNIWLIAMVVAATIVTLWISFTSQPEAPCEGTILYSLDTRFPDGFLSGIRKGVNSRVGSGIYTVRCGAKRRREKPLHYSSGASYRIIAANAERVLFECGIGGRYDYYIYDLRKKRIQPFRWHGGDGRLVWADKRSNITLAYKDGVVYARGGSTARQVLARLGLGAKRVELLSAGLSVDMNKMAVSNGRVVVILDVLAGKVIASVEGNGFAWSPQAPDVIALSSAGRVRLYSVGSVGLRTIATAKGETDERVLCWDPSGKFLLSSFRGIDLYRLIPESCMLMVRDTDNGLEVVQRIPAGGWGCYSAAWIE